MKKIISLILIICIASMALASCSISNYRYDFSEKYTKGGGSVAENVKALDIEWIAGNVEIKYHGEDSVVFYEDSEFELTDKTSMYHYFDGRTLHIKFHKAGIHTGITKDKTLTVFLPQSLVLDELELELVSADANIEEISASNISVDVVSGDVSITASCDIREISIEIVSGDVKCNLVGKIGDMDIEETSGDINLTFASVPSELSIENVSGNTTLNLTEDADFRLEYESASGDFSSELTYTSTRNVYTFGNGTANVEYESASGDLNIKKQ